MNYQREYILNEFQRLVFSELGEHINRIEKLNADASERNIYRLFTSQRTLIGIHNIYTDENTAFIKFSESFKKAGLKVPVVYGVSNDSQIYIEEDLGDNTLFKFSQTAPHKNTSDLFLKALSDLQDFQIKGIDCIDFSYCYQSKEFSEVTIHSDFEKFEDYYITRIKRSEIDEELFNYAKEFLSEINRNTDKEYFLYRDFQTRNIMVKENELYYIDYQSGRIGPPHYDAASFLYSGSINITEDERNFFLRHYIDSLNSKIYIDKEKFKYEFYFFALMRLIQILGSYGYTYEKKKDEMMLKKIPKAIENIRGLKNNISEPLLLKFIDKITT
ncbi:MAG: phosphotransferase [Ignavibacteria bacterium]